MLIQNATITDDTGTRLGSVQITNGMITAVGESLPVQSGDEVIDAAGKTLLPAFIDLHCHFRTPGFTYKEDITSGSRAAAAGGYTLVNCMANTKPVCSTAEIAHAVMAEARRVGLCDVNQVVSITKDFDGKTLTHLESLPEDIRFISEDGKGVQSNAVMWHTMQIAAQKGLTVMSHAEDMDISGEDYRLAENIETARNIFLAQYTGAHLHMCHVSTQQALADVTAAKQRGVHVTCEVTPHHIWFADNGFRVNPPIRTAADVAYIIEAMRRGEVDAIATDHAPHSPEDKAKGAPGMVGMETAFGVCYTKLCVQNGLPLQRLSRMMSRGPAEILGVNKGRIAPGFDGDAVLVDTQAVYTVHADALHGKSHNTPFDGTALQGRVLLTVKQGKVTYKA